MHAHLEETGEISARAPKFGSIASTPAVRHDVGSAFQYLVRRTSPRLRLFCFPYAGAGPSAFRDWIPSIANDTDLVGVVYPGRESRAAERPITRLSFLVDALLAEIGSHLNCPFAFFGHSMGAYVAFELARALGSRRQVAEHVFISAAGAPHLPEPRPIHALGSRDFVEALVRLNGFPPEVLRHAELVRYALPILRADLTACETHRFDIDTPCRFPISAYAGSRDPRIAKERVEAWRAVAGASFSFRVFEGDHFFLRDHQESLLADIQRHTGLQG